MSALFTHHAIERMRTIAAAPGEKQQLADLFSTIDAAADPAELTTALPGTVELGKNESGKAFLVRSGRLRAVVTIEPDHPDRIVVATVYQDDDENTEAQGTTGEDRTIALST